MLNDQIVVFWIDSITRLSPKYTMDTNITEEYRHYIYWMTDIVKFFNINMSFDRIKR